MLGAITNVHIVDISYPQLVSQFGRKGVPNISWNCSPKNRSHWHWDIYTRLWIHFLVAFYLRFQSPLNSFLVPETAMFIFRIRQFICVSWRFSHRENKWWWCSLSLKNQIFMVIYRYSLSQSCAFLSKFHFTVEKNFLSRLSKNNSYYSDK